jgi:uncharacterized protein (UPF0212 family)
MIDQADVGRGLLGAQWRPVECELPHADCGVCGAVSSAAFVVAAMLI